MKTKSASLLTAFLFLLVPLSVVGVEAQLGPLPEDLSDLAGTADGLLSSVESSDGGFLVPAGAQATVAEAGAKLLPLADYVPFNAALDGEFEGPIGFGFVPYYRAEVSEEQPLGGSHSLRFLDVDLAEATALDDPGADNGIYRAYGIGVMKVEPGLRFGEISSIVYGVLSEQPDASRTGELQTNNYINLDQDGDGLTDGCISQNYQDITSSPAWTTKVTLPTTNYSTKNWLNCNQDDEFPAFPSSWGPGNKDLPGYDNSQPSVPLHQLQQEVGEAFIKSIAIQVFYAGNQPGAASQPVYVDGFAVNAASPMDCVPSEGPAENPPLDLVEFDGAACTEFLLSLTDGMVPTGDILPFATPDIWAKADGTDWLITSDTLVLANDAATGDISVTLGGGPETDGSSTGYCRLPGALLSDHFGDGGVGFSFSTAACTEGNTGGTLVPPVDGTWVHVAISEAGSAVPEKQHLYASNPVGLMALGDGGGEPGGDFDCSDDSDPLYAQMCGIAQQLENIIETQSLGTVEPLQDEGGEDVDADNDGRPDVAVITLNPLPTGGQNDPTGYLGCASEALSAQDPGPISGCDLADTEDTPVNPVYLQLDYFYDTPDSTPVHTLEPGDDFDIPVTGVMIYDPVTGSPVTGGTEDTLRLTDHYGSRDGSPTGYYGIYTYDADLEGGYGACLACVQPETHRIAINAGPATHDAENGGTSTVGLLVASGTGFALDLDLFDPSDSMAIEDSIQESGDDPTQTMILLDFPALGTAGVSIGFPDEEPPDLSYLHIKYPGDPGQPIDLIGSYTKYSNLDDDPNTDYEELTCPGQPTNPTNPAAHCGDWDGDGIVNSQDGAPRTPYFELVLELADGQAASAEAPTAVDLKYSCTGAITPGAVERRIDGGAWAAYIASSGDCNVQDASLDGGTEFKNALQTDRSIDFRLAAKTPGGNDVYSNVVSFTLLGNAPETGTLTWSCTNTACTGGAFPAEGHDEASFTVEYAVTITLDSEGKTNEGQTITEVKVNDGSSTITLEDQGGGVWKKTKTYLTSRDTAKTVTATASIKDSGDAINSNADSVDFTIPKRQAVPNSAPTVSHNADSDRTVEYNDDGTFSAAVFYAKATDADNPAPTGLSVQVHYAEVDVGQSAPSSEGAFTGTVTLSHIECLSMLDLDPDSSSEALSACIEGPVLGEEGDEDTYTKNGVTYYARHTGFTADKTVWYYVTVDDGQSESNTGRDDNSGQYFHFDTIAGDPLVPEPEYVVPDPLDWVVGDCNFGSDAQTGFGNIPGGDRPSECDSLDTSPIDALVQAITDLDPLGALGSGLLPGDEVDFRDTDGDPTNDDEPNGQIDFVEMYVASYDMIDRPLNLYVYQAGGLTPPAGHTLRLGVGDDAEDGITKLIVLDLAGDVTCAYVAPGEGALPSTLQVGTGATEAAACAASDFPTDLGLETDGGLRVIDTRDGSIILGITLGATLYDTVIHTPQGDSVLGDVVADGYDEDDGWYIIIPNADCTPPSVTPDPGFDPGDCPGSEQLPLPGQSGDVDPGELPSAGLTEDEEGNPAIGIDTDGDGEYDQIIPIGADDPGVEGCLDEDPETPCIADALPDPVEVVLGLLCSDPSPFVDSPVCGGDPPVDIEQIIGELQACIDDTEACLSGVPVTVSEDPFGIVVDDGSGNAFGVYVLSDESGAPYGVWIDQNGNGGEPDEGEVYTVSDVPDPAEIVLGLLCSDPSPFVDSPVCGGDPPVDIEQIIGELQACIDDTEACLPDVPVTVSEDPFGIVVDDGSGNAFGVYLLSDESGPYGVWIDSNGDQVQDEGETVGAEALPIPSVDTCKSKANQGEDIYACSYDPDDDRYGSWLGIGVGIKVYGVFIPL